MLPSVSSFHTFQTLARGDLQSYDSGGHLIHCLLQNSSQGMPLPNAPMSPSFLLLLLPSFKMLLHTHKYMYFAILRVSQFNLRGKKERKRLVFVSP